MRKRARERINTTATRYRSLCKSNRKIGDSMTEKREAGRRSSDEVLHLLAPHIENDENVQGKILLQLHKIETAQTEMLELLTLFKNTKGFFATVKSVGTFVIWLTVFSGAVWGVLQAIKSWARN